MDWDNARRVREPIAWILLIIATVDVALGIWTLAGLPGGPYIGDGVLQDRALLAVNFFAGATRRFCRSSQSCSSPSPAA